MALTDRGLPRTILKMGYLTCIVIRESPNPNRLYTSESDVCRRQNLTSKDGHRSVRVNLLIMAVDP